MRCSPAFIDAGSDNLTVHVEACRHLHRTIQTIKDAGVRASVVLNPATSLHAAGRDFAGVAHGVAHVGEPRFWWATLYSINPGQDPCLKAADHRHGVCKWPSKSMVVSIPPMPAPSARLVLMSWSLAQPFLASQTMGKRFVRCVLKSATANGGRAAARHAGCCA